MDTLDHLWFVSILLPLLIYISFINTEETVTEKTDPPIPTHWVELLSVISCHLHNHMFIYTVSVTDFIP